MSCSFCKLQGHNIRMCNNVLIDIHYHRMKTIYMNILTQVYPHNIENYTETGELILHRLFNLQVLRVIGVQYLWITARMTKDQLIPLIWNYFKNRIYFTSSLLEEEQETFIDRSVRMSVSSINTMITTMNMRSYYRHDAELVNRILMRMGIVRNLVNEFDAVVEEAAPQVEPVVENKRYNIIPILILNDDEDKKEDCPICYENIKCADLIRLNCSHQFCGKCITNILEIHNQTSNPTCALCRTLMKNFSVKNIEIYNLVYNYCI